MNPHTRSLWMPEHDAASHPVLPRDMATDVLVVGGGITGLTAALRLAEAGQRVILVEARTLCSGVTGYTTAHATEAIDARYHTIARRFGAEAARLVALASRAAIEHIADRAQRFDIRCDLRRIPGFLYCEEPGDRDELGEEFEAARKAGLVVERDAPVALPFPVNGSLRFHDQLRFHPRAYVLGLAKAATAAGVQIFEHSRVTELHDGDPVIATVEELHRVHARSVILATHSPLNKLFLQTRLKHMQSYAVAFQGRAIDDGLYWDTADPYHYLRTATVDGVAHLIVGGADHPVGADQPTEIAFERVLSYSRARFGTDRPTFHWSAQVTESADGLPLIGVNAASRNVYVATGFAGNGMTFGTFSGILLTDLVLGRKNPLAELFSPRRMKASILGRMLVSATEMPVHLIADRLSAPEVRSTRQIEKDQGRTMKLNGKRLAVYRDPHGRLHAVSGTCTHMGCLVHFNDAERTWDCPCHGSRFGIDGDVLDGPAVQALTRYRVDESPAEPPEAASIARPPVGEPSHEPTGPAPDPNPGLDGFK